MKKYLPYIGGAAVLALVWYLYSKGKATKPNTVASQPNPFYTAGSSPLLDPNNAANFGFDAFMNQQSDYVRID